MLSVFQSFFGYLYNLTSQVRKDGIFCLCLLPSLTSLCLKEKRVHLYLNTNLSQFCFPFDLHRLGGRRYESVLKSSPLNKPINKHSINKGLNGHEFEQTLGDSEGQGSLACCSPWGRKESNMT